MSERKTPWTPGPWRIDGNRVWSSDETAVYIAEVPEYLRERTAKADRRLIAEAPAMAELLAEAAAAIADCHEYRSHHHQETERKIRALLARVGAP